MTILRHRSRGALAGLALALAAAVATPAEARRQAADAAPPAAPPAPTTALTAPGVRGPRIAAEDAVARTLAASYTVKQQVAKVDERSGVLGESLGIFDPLFTVEGEYQFLQQDLLRPELTDEIRRRVAPEFAAIATPLGPPGALDRAATGLETGIAQASQIIVSDCQTSDTRFIVDAGDRGSATLCLDANGNLRGIVIDGLAVRGTQLERLVATFAVLEGLGAEFETDIQRQIREFLLQTASLLRGMAEALRQQRARLGDLPEEAELMDMRLEVGGSKLFGNGLNLSTTLALRGTGDDFDGKRHLAVFGGTSSPETFSTSLAMRLLVPLGRGLGYTSVSGPSRAAAEAVEAEGRLARHTASQEAFATLQSYWDVAAAERRVALLAQSLTARERVLELSRELINANELAGVEAARAEAGRAEAARQVSEARSALIDARLDLVVRMGEPISIADEAPLAADPLPDGAALTLEPDAWYAIARNERDDMAAAAGATRATDLLRQTAKADLRRQVDLALLVSYGGLEESFDMQIWELQGYLDAASGHLAGPSYAIGLRFDWPFGNHAARGRLLQAESTLYQSQINEADLGRQVRIGLGNLAEKIDRRRAEIVELRKTLADLEQTLNASQERFRLGDLTLFDVLTTETQLTNARISLLEAERDLATLVTQVRFETGTLLAGDSEETFDPSSLRLVPLTTANPGS